MSILLISGSLREESRSRVLVQKAYEVLQSEGVEARYIDLRDYPLPLCDGGPAYDHANVSRLSNVIKPAKVILLGIPIYNFDANAAVKNMVELTGENWENKVVGFFCSAGGRSSYMSIMNLGNDLMLDFRCVIIPRFVYAVGGDFTEPPTLSFSNMEIEERVSQLALEAIRFTRL